MKKGASISVLLEALAESLSAEEIIASTVKADVANQITEWRVARNMNQQEMADYCGVQQSTISKWENGDLNFTIEKMAEIACKLDLVFKVSLSSKRTEVASTGSTSRTDNISNFSCYARNGSSYARNDSNWISGASNAAIATLRGRLDDTDLMEG